MFLKDGSEVIACPLSHIINLALHSSQIPEDMKNARVVPRYKKNKVKLSLETTDLFPFSVLLPKVLREQCTTSCNTTNGFWKLYRHGDD